MMSFARVLTLSGLTALLAAAPACSRSSETGTKPAEGAAVAKAATPPAAPAPAAAAPAATPPAPKGTVFGPGVSSSTESVPLSRIVDQIDSYDGKRVRVEGEILDVCPNRGCWIEIAGDRAGESVRFKVVDGVIAFPTSVKGRRVIAEGIVHKVAGAPPPPPGGAHECGGEGHEPGHDCSTTAGARARLEGVGAVVLDPT